jgi:hypothetical protein
VIFEEDEIMKKYEELEMEIIKFSIEDVIATSPIGGDEGGTDDPVIDDDGEY